MESILVGVNNFFAIFSKISSFLWSFPTQFSGWKSIPVLGQFTLLVLLLLGAGIWFTIKTGFVQIKNFKKGIKILSQKKSVEIGISPFASFMLSSAMRIGAGNITGVTGAIAVGGPGALFWMWLSAFFGMATAFVEATLSQIFKERKGDEYVGGLTHYAEKIFRNKHWVGISIAIAFLFYRLLSMPVHTFHVFTAVGTVISTVTGHVASRTSVVYYVLALVTWALLLRETPRRKYPIPTLRSAAGASPAQSILLSIRRAFPLACTIPGNMPHRTVNTRRSSLPMASNGTSSMPLIP